MSEVALSLVLSVGALGRSLGDAFAFTTSVKNVFSSSDIPEGEKGVMCIYEGKGGGAKVWKWRDASHGIPRGAR